MKLNNQLLDLLVYWMQERQNIYLKRQQNLPAPWTEDEILHNHKFTNVFREQDKTTVWFKENIREPLRDNKDVVFATIMFRWFNWIPTGEIILSLNKYNEFEIFRNWPVYRKEFIEAMKDQEQMVNGCFLVRTPARMNKVEGISWCLDKVWDGLDPLVEARDVTPSEVTLQSTHKFLMQFLYLGPFMSYEIVTDLRHTYFLENAPDIMTWTNPGPGAARGVYRLLDKTDDVKSFPKTNNPLLLETMRFIMPLLSQRTGLTLELRDVEHSLCEFDKYCRVYFEEGRAPKQRYRHEN